MANNQDPKRKSFASRASSFLKQGQWAVELGTLPTFQALRLKLSRVIFLTARGFHADRCMFRASGLTYITILSLVPMLAFAFSVAKGLGAYGKLREGTIDPFLERTFGPVDGAAAGGMGEVRGVIEKVLGFVENTQVSGLGVAGLAVLAFAVIKVLGSIEQSFNEIWGIRHSRTLIRKVADYMSITVVVPILLVTATGVSSAAQNGGLGKFLRARMQEDSPLIEFYAAGSSLLVMWIGFAFVYLFMPNTKVKLSSALVGGIVGGSLWHLMQVLHVEFQMGMAKHNALYAGFAALPVFMIWIHLSWVTVLLGAETAHAHQAESSYHRRIGALRLTQNGREVMALRAIVRIVTHFVRGESAPNLEQLATSNGVPAETLAEVLDPVCNAELLVRTENGDDISYLPARDPSLIRVQEVLDSLRGWSEEDLKGGDLIDQKAGECLAEAHAALRDSRHNLDLRHLAKQCTEEDAQGEAHADELPTPDGSLA